MKWLLLVPALFLILNGCDVKNLTKSGVQKPVMTSLPLLLASRIHPLKEKQMLWKDNGSYFEYMDQSIPSGEPHQNNEAAVQSAREFLFENFGLLPDPVRSKRIIPSAYGRQRITRPDDLGHTVTFNSWHEGFRLDGSYAVIYLKGKQVWMAVVSLYSVKSIPESEKVLLISEKDALKIWGEGVEKAFGMKNARADSIELRYGASPSDKNSHREKEAVIQPYWVITFNKTTELNVDAFTGMIWRND